MRVALLTSSFPRWPDDASGHFVLSHARALAASHDVTIFAPALRVAPPGMRAFDLRANALFGWPGAPARIMENPARLILFPQSVWRARRALVSAGSFERVVAHFLFPSAIFWAAGLSAPLEVRLHGADVRLFTRLPPRVRERVIEGLLRRGSVQFVFAAESSRRAFLSSLGRSRALVRERSTSEHPELERAGSAALAGNVVRGRRPSGPVVVVAGRLVRSKRVDLAIETLATIPEACLVVVGDGPERKRLERLANTVLRNPAQFTGLLPRTEALRWIGEASALLHTSLDEAAPSVVREALALGTPVVATDAGDLQRWSLEAPGITLAPADPNALAGALRQVLSGATSGGP